MKATDMLKAEHKIIERVLAVLNLASVALAHGKSVSPDILVTITDFMRTYTEGLHFQKEETVLFKALEHYGVSTTDGTAGSILSEHAQSREYLQKIRASVLLWKAGDQAARADVIWAASSYTDLLRAHIAKEHSVLFPLAQQTIPENEHGFVAEAFKQIDRQKTSEDVQQKYLKLIESLEEESRDWR
jgi:hemerythrin-like domain-containing protein